MARNGSGTFSRLYDWTDDAAAGTKISSTRMDAEMDGMATALTDSIAKDGQTTPTANLPMGNFLHTGVGAATARTHYTRASQTQDSSLVYASAGGTANAITLTLAPAITAYAAGQRFHFIASGTNTGAVTLNVNGVGATAVKKAGGTAFVGGEIVSGQACSVVHDGTDFELESANGEAIRVDVASVAGTTVLSTSASNYVRITGTNTITAFTLSDGHWRDVVAGGAFSITAGASLIFPGVASGTTITLAAGDTFRIVGEASSVVRVVSFTRALGGADGLLSTTTASAAASANITLPAGYRNYKVMFDATVATDGDEIYLRVGTGSPPTYQAGAIDYEFSTSRISSGGTAADTPCSVGLTEITIATNVGNAAAEGVDGNVTIYNPANTARHKNIIFDTAVWDNTATPLFWRAFGGGSYNAATSAITGLQILASSGTISGTFKLYGYQ